MLPRTATRGRHCRLHATKASQPQWNIWMEQCVQRPVHFFHLLSGRKVAFLSRFQTDMQIKNITKGKNTAHFPGCERKRTFLNFLTTKSSPSEKDDQKEYGKDWKILCRRAVRQSIEVLYIFFNALCFLLLDGVPTKSQKRKILKAVGWREEEEQKNKSSSQKTNSRSREQIMELTLAWC